MKKPLYVFADLSGSMIEMGKAHLQRNLCRFISQLQVVHEEKYSEFEIRFFQWTNSVVELSVQDDGDIPALNPQGTSNFNSLSEFLSINLNSSQMLRVLLLTDGNFQKDELERFLKWSNELSGQLVIRAVAIGADANVFMLKRLLTNERVYLPENISAAVDSVCAGMDSKVAGPESVKQIQIIEPAETSDDWDD